MTRLWLCAAAASSVSAQCVQCLRSAGAQQQSAIAAMNRGIVLLLIPVFLLLAGFCWLAYQRRDS